MSTIRTATISSLITIVLALAVYVAALPHTVRAAEPGPATCPIVSVSSLSTQQLWDLLNARYEYRVGMPR
jgi:hypothetical protein